MMYSESAKIKKSARAGEPTEFELSISQALFELQMNSDLKSSLRELHITSAEEIEVDDKKAIVIFVPDVQLRGFHKIQLRLVRELEKKFSGKHVVLISEKRKSKMKPLKKAAKDPSRAFPFRHSSIGVQEQLLNDICFPAEIVGRRIRVKKDGSNLIKVHLDKTQQTNVEHKLDTFISIYKKYTARDVVFEFPEYLL